MFFIRNIQRKYLFLRKALEPCILTAVSYTHIEQHFHSKSLSFRKNMDVLKNVKTSQMSVTNVESISLNSDFHPAYSFLSKFGFDENWLIWNVQKTVQIFDSKVEKNINIF